MRGLTEALDRDASDADARFFLGIALEAAGQHEAAVATGLRFRELDPLSPMAGVLLGSSFWFDGHAGKGLEALEHAIALDPENPIVRWTFGYTHALLGNREIAREQAQWMQTRAPAMPYTAHLLSLVYAMDRRPAAARPRGIPAHRRASGPAHARVHCRRLTTGPRFE